MLLHSVELGAPPAQVWGQADPLEPWREHLPPRPGFVRRTKVRTMLTLCVHREAEGDHVCGALARIPGTRSIPSKSAFIPALAEIRPMLRSVRPPGARRGAAGEGGCGVSRSRTCLLPLARLAAHPQNNREESVKT